MSSKSNSKNNTKKSAIAVDLALFTVAGSDSRSGGGDGSACYNARLRRLTLPSSALDGAVAFTVTGASDGSDALLLAPCERGGGRALHRTEHFIVIQKNLAEALKSRRYDIAPTESGALLLTGRGDAQPEPAVKVAKSKKGSK